MAFAADARARRADRASGAVALVATAALLPSLSTHADPAAVVNALRAQGCAGTAAVGTDAKRDSALDAAARALAGDGDLGRALARVGYPAARSTSFTVRGSAADEVIRTMLTQRYCAVLNDAAYTELGFYQRRDSTWIVLAGRKPQPFAALQDPKAVAERVFELVNAARGSARDCGRDHFGPAPPLAFSTVLTAAASLHSLDMAERGRLGHDGSDGSVSGDRVTRAGYAWQGSGENVAAGQPDAAAVVAAWLSSPGHCATLMESKFTETGIAFALAPGKNPDVYWTQVFAAPL